MGFLIDTRLWIAVERGKLGAADIHVITQQAPIYLSPVNIAEIRFGIDLMTNAAQKQLPMAMLRRKPYKRDFTVLTSNAKDFEDVPGLRFFGGKCAVVNAGCAVGKTALKLSRLMRRRVEVTSGKMAVHRRPQ